MHLAIDTTTSKSLLALKLDGELIERRFEPRSTQRVIFSELANLLDPDALGSLSKITVGIGPGSFTGVKIGVMAAKTLAWSRNISIAGVCSMDAVASGTPMPEHSETKLVVAVPSTRGEAYVRIFSIENNDWIPSSEIHDVKLDPEKLERVIPRVKLIISGEAGENLAGVIESIREIEMVDEEYRYPRAGGVMKLGERKFKGGAEDDPLELAPMYVRPSQPERLEKEGKS